FPGFKAPVHALTFSPDGKRLAAGAGQPNFGAGQVKIWDVGSGRETGSGGRLLFSVNALRFSPDGTRLALDGEGRLTILDGTTGAELVSMRGGAGLGCLGSRFATASNDAVVLWDAHLERPQATLKESAEGK